MHMAIISITFYRGNTAKSLLVIGQTTSLSLEDSSSIEISNLSSAGNLIILISQGDSESKNTMSLGSRDYRFCADICYHTYVST